MRKTILLLHINLRYKQSIDNKEFVDTLLNQTQMPLSELINKKASVKDEEDLNEPQWTDQSKAGI